MLGKTWTHGYHFVCTLCAFVLCTIRTHLMQCHFYQFSVHNYTNTSYSFSFYRLLCSLLLIVNHLILVLQWSMLLHDVWLQCSYFNLHFMYFCSLWHLSVIVLYYCQLSSGFFPRVGLCIWFSPGLYRVSTDLNQLSCDSSLAPGCIQL